ncbi:MAG: hypothetical protein LBO65_03740, partial [Spirochaetaceae bacterium]|nr:hypothetical protein [Spirochaetaceae bacterium]
MRVKKNVLLLALALAVSGVAFGLPEFKVSFGGGGIFSTVLGNGWKYSENGVNLKETNTMVEGGGFAFFDATFVEADFAFLGGGITNKYSSNGRSDTSSGSLSALDLAFLGKYPVSLGPVTVFPLLGFDYLIVTS